MGTGAGRPRNAPPKVKIKTYTYALRNTQLLNAKILFLAVKSPPSETLHVRLGGGGAAPKANALFSKIGFKKLNTNYKNNTISDASISISLTFSTGLLFGSKSLYIFL